MAPIAPVKPWSLVLPEALHSRLHGHLFPGDHDEHGAVIEAGIAESARGVRLLARDVFLARDGVDYVPGTRGYRQLVPEYIGQRVRHCRDERLVYLAIHNHGGRGAVAFSPQDIASHERGYPALLDITRGMAVGALVFSEDGVAGDIWMPDRQRAALRSTTVVGRRIVRLSAVGQTVRAPIDDRYERQSRLFGDAGQAILAQQKVGVIGSGGVGMLLVEYLSRLGVGDLIVVDPDRVDRTNLSRLPGARRSDARTWFKSSRWPAPLRAFGRRVATPKVRVAERLAREANEGIRVEAVFDNALEPDVARRLTDCDYLFLAADTMQARLLFNAIVHQYLIPGVQLGAKVRVEAATGDVIDVHTIARPVTPDSGCLWCNGLILPAQLTEESLSDQERQAQRYVEDAEVIAPSVITLNAIAAAHAANDFLFAVTGLMEAAASLDYLRIRPRIRSIRWDEPRRDPGCPESGLHSGSRFARGDGIRLPTRAKP